jgi:hypothetical protein
MKSTHASQVAPTSIPLCKGRLSVEPSSSTMSEALGRTPSGVSSFSVATSGTGMTDAPDEEDSHGLVTLRNVVGVSVACIVTISVLVSLVPTTVLWASTSKTLSDTASASATTQAAAYRGEVVANTKLRLSEKLGVPLTVTDIILNEITSSTTNGSAFDHASEIRAVLHPLSLVFPDFLAMVRISIFVAFYFCQQAGTACSFILSLELRC